MKTDPTKADPTIRFDGNALILHFPENDHEVSIPINRCEVISNNWGTPLPNQRGWYALLDILHARYSATCREQRTISTPSGPTIYQIEQMLKLPPKRKTVAKAELTLEDLDL